jgi:hypothetical protein
VGRGAAVAAVSAGSAGAGGTARKTCWHRVHFTDAPRAGRRFSSSS